MCDEWMARLDIPLTPQQYQRLPRNSAYRYDYFDGRAWLNPRPRYYHALLDLTVPPRAAVCEHAAPRPLQPGDWEALVAPFAAAFRGLQPFGGLGDEERAEAARQCLEQTRRDGDGPWIERASFVAVSGDGETPLGAILVTLLPDIDPTDFDAYYWPQPPPPDCVEKRLGRPHMTWVFVTPGRDREGVGTRLLQASTQVLAAMGFTELASTFLIGNDPSMLWHWRNGFRLLAYPGSRRS
jgi:hypothetical protein